MSPSISLLVAAYNEEASLARTLDRALATLNECVTDWELLIMDDCSTDRTPHITADYAARFPGKVRAMRHAVNQGIATTFEDLYRAATKEYVFLISGDGEYPPEALKQCMPLLAENDIVICRRVVKHYTFYRHCISHAYRWSILLLFGVDLFDPGGVKVVKREIFRDIPVYCKSVFVEAERIIRAIKRGYSIAHVDIIQEPRMGGRGRGARFATVWAAAKDLVVVWVTIILLRKQ